MKAKFVLICICGLLLMSCKSTQIATKTETSETFNYERVHEKTAQYDSISHFKHDSTVVFIRGDTITVDRWHTVHLYKTRRDTIMRADTVVVMKNITHKEIELIEVNKLTSFQKWQIKCFWIFGSLILIIGIYIVLKFYFKHLKK